MFDYYLQRQEFDNNYRDTLLDGFIGTSFEMHCKNCNKTEIGKLEMNSCSDCGSSDIICSIKKMSRTKDDLSMKIVDVIILLATSVAMFEYFNLKRFLPVAATQLRLLLCDTTHEKGGKVTDNSLLQKYYTNNELVFHPICVERRVFIDDVTGGECSYLPAQDFFYKEATVNEIFDTQSAELALPKWLGQELFHFSNIESITIKDVIRSFSDKHGGAHVDSELKHKDLFAIGFGEFHVYYIACYILDYHHIVDNFLINPIHIRFPHLSNMDMPDIEYMI